MTIDIHSRDAEQLAQEILLGFQRHYDRFSQITAQARQRFADGAWLAGQQAAAARIHFYDERVKETTEHLREQTHGVLNEELWRLVRLHYQALLQFHPQAELAETFYNSVFCNLFHRRYFHNSYIFVESTLARTLPLAVETEYRSYFPVAEGLARCLLQIVETADFAAPFADLKRDLRQLQVAFQEQALSVDLQPEQSRIDVLKAPFYRNKAAYIVGRLVTTTATYPFIVPVLRSKQGLLYIDALITDRDHMAIIFGFARTYFMVQSRAPSALVRFLKDVMPNKTLAELYSAIGLHKQSKTEFYREFLQHLDSSVDQLVPAAGIKGMVMTVFTLPSFPYVFKVIKDVFGGNKSMDRATVIDRYRLVKRHDRAGRMADTYEFANVAIPLLRISPELLEELQSTVAGSLKIDGDYLIIRHLFVERRMIPLNLFLETASSDEINGVMRDYGQAIKDMIAANIFPGDMLLKNFGLTRQRRVVFYDYDEVRYLTDMNFRPLPRAQTADEQMAAEPWYAVGPDDMFPEQLPVFAVPQPKLRQALMRFHADLATPEFWQRQQQNIQQGIVSDVFPYPESLRFINQTPQTG